MNCLQYALKFWKDNPEYDIYYDNDHVINLRRGMLIDDFLTLDNYGFEHIFKSFKDTLNQDDIHLLKSYFNEKNTPAFDYACVC